MGLPGTLVRATGQWPLRQRSALWRLNPGGLLVRRHALVDAGLHRRRRLGVCRGAGYDEGRPGAGDSPREGQADQLGSRGGGTWTHAYRVATVPVKRLNSTCGAAAAFTFPESALAHGRTPGDIPWSEAEPDHVALLGRSGYCRQHHARTASV